MRRVEELGKREKRMLDSRVAKAAV